jgi:hypothetical protein
VTAILKLLSKLGGRRQLIDEADSVKRSLVIR